MSENKRGQLLVISGFSGAGKGTVVSKLLSLHPDRYRISISATTRSPRDGEQDGIHYFFVSTEKFEQMIRQGELLEHARYVDHYYGTPRRFVEDSLDAGYDVILEIEQQGAFQVKKAMPQAMLIFISPPSAGELERRLRGRGTESEEQIRSRLARACEEAEYIDRYDYFVLNDTVDRCAAEIENLVEAERCKVCHNRAEADRLREDLRVYRKEER